MQWLRSLVFTLFLFVWTGLYSVFFVVACRFLQVRQRFALARVYAHVLLTVLRWVCGLGYRVEGIENFPFGAHVALWKHSSAWETIAQFVIGRPQVLVLKGELMWVPFFGWALKQLRSIPIDRSAGTSAVLQVVDEGSARMQQGLWVLVFPEGTRMPAGETRKYGVSGALLATRTGCKVIPVAHDSGYYWGRRGLLKKPGTIRVVIGRPIDAAGRDPRELNAEVQKWIEATVAEIRKGAPSA